jgi:hypothetical protein
MSTESLRKGMLRKIMSVVDSTDYLVALMNQFPVQKVIMSSNLLKNI